MGARLIAMLTRNDNTVENAIEVFEQYKNAPTNYWGFKDTGTDKEKMKSLIERMKSAGKTTFLEVLNEKEDECIRFAKFAIEFEFDYLIGMHYFDTVNDLLRSKPIKYFPTCGKRSGIPRMLEGPVEEIISEAKQIEKAGADGLTLSAYRYRGNPEELSQEFVKEIQIPIIITGSINNYERLDLIKSLNPWGFTVGSAFFNKDFGKNLTLAGQIERVVDYIGD
jgi:hypothetical protein